MDVPADRSRPTSAPPLHPTLREAARSPRRRRPTGAAPPLPYRLQTSGIGWLVAALVLWQQVASLRTARIAHHDLALASVMVDKQGQVWLVDFERAEAAASQVPLDRDAATMLAAPDGVADPALARATAEQALGPDTVARMLPRAWGYAGHPRPGGPRILTEQERYPGQPRLQSATLGSATIYCSSGTNPVPVTAGRADVGGYHGAIKSGDAIFLFVQLRRLGDHSRWPPPLITTALTSDPPTRWWHAAR
jgi:hypothetical protein